MKRTKSGSYFRRLTLKTDLFTIGKFTLHGYGTMIVIGFVIALLVATYRAKRY